MEEEGLTTSLFLSKYKIGDLLSTMFCKNKMSREDRQKWKLKMYSLWEDTFEQRLAGVKAAKAKLEEQIKRDAMDRLHDDIRESSE